MTKKEGRLFSNEQEYERIKNIRGQNKNDTTESEVNMSVAGKESSGLTRRQFLELGFSAGLSCVDLVGCNKGLLRRKEPSIVNFERAIISEEYCIYRGKKSYCCEVNRYSDSTFAPSFDGFVGVRDSEALSFLQEIGFMNKFALFGNLKYNSNFLDLARSIRRIEYDYRHKKHNPKEIKPIGQLLHLISTDAFLFKVFLDFIRIGGIFLPMSERENKEQFGSLNFGKVLRGSRERNVIYFNKTNEPISRVESLFNGLLSYISYKIGILKLENYSDKSKIGLHKEVAYPIKARFSIILSLLRGEMPAYILSAEQEDFYKSLMDSYLVNLLYMNEVNLKKRKFSIFLGNMRIIIIEDLDFRYIDLRKSGNIAEITIPDLKSVNNELIINKLNINNVKYRQILSSILDDHRKDFKLDRGPILTKEQIQDVLFLYSINIILLESIYNLAKIFEEKSGIDFMQVFPNEKFLVLVSLFLKDFTKYEVNQRNITSPREFAKSIVEKISRANVINTILKQSVSR